MSKYCYTAFDFSGKKVNGEIFGTSEQNVLNDLKKQQLFPVKIVLDKSADSNYTKTGLKGPKIKKKQIATFLRQFASMVRSGMLIMVILDVLIKEERSREFREILKMINADIMKGDTLSTAMAKSRVFPQVVISMAEVGEANGKLDSSIEKVAKSMENELKLFAKMKGAMIYPTVLFSVTIVACTFLTIFVLPIFANMFEQSGTTLPLLTRVLLGISKFITSKWYIVLGLIALLVSSIVKILRTPRIRIIVDKHIYRIPTIGRAINIMAMAHFCRTLASLIEGGVEVVRSLEIVRNVINNLYMKMCFEEVIQDVKKGSAISQAISKYSIFTPLVVSSLKIAEESGNIGEVLSRTSELYEEESAVQLQKISSLLEPAVTIIMAVGVGLIVISIIQPMFQMYTLIGK